MKYRNDMEFSPDTNIHNTLHHTSLNGCHEHFFNSNGKKGRKKMFWVSKGIRTRLNSCFKQKSADDNR